ncbi:hypothetical protein VP1G_06971 [Cytospora mali]|uniref:Uncharacterized protein n=1 Tax=Cytospora mali TaxID=578113 RepID=A0A194V720_CYTMA|nr:hypothetical protein VP1G_06971 [Valsa mali var. pyri (nom. inval.)]
MLTGIDGGCADGLARYFGAEDWPTNYREEDIELDEECLAVHQSMSRQSQLEVPHREMDEIHAKMSSHSSSRLGKPKSPLERFYSEQHRHEKIAFMMRVDRDETDTHHGRTEGHICSLKLRAPPEFCSQHENVRSKGFANEASPQNRPPSPAFQPYLEVDRSHLLEEAAEEVDDSYLEDIRLAACINGGANESAAKDE